MPRIVVSERAYEMLRLKAHQDLADAARRLVDGSLETEISGHLYAQLETARFPGETLSAVILRYLPIRGGGRR